MPVLVCYDSNVPLLPQVFGAFTTTEWKVSKGQYLSGGGRVVEVLGRL